MGAERIKEVLEGGRGRKRILIGFSKHFCESGCWEGEDSEEGRPFLPRWLSTIARRSRPPPSTPSPLFLNSLLLHRVGLTCPPPEKKGPNSVRRSEKSFTSLRRNGGDGRKKQDEKEEEGEEIEFRKTFFSPSFSSPHFLFSHFVRGRSRKLFPVLRYGRAFPCFPLFFSYSV